MGTDFGPLHIWEQFWAHSAGVDAIQHAVAQLKICSGWLTFAHPNYHFRQVGTEPSLGRGEQCHVGEVRKRKFCVPRFVAQNSLVI